MDRSARHDRDTNLSPPCVHDRDTNLSPLCPYFHSDENPLYWDHHPPHTGEGPSYTFGNEGKKRNKDGPRNGADLD